MAAADVANKLAPYLDILSLSQSDKFHQWGEKTFRTALNWAFFAEKILDPLDEDQLSLVQGLVNKQQQEDGTVVKLTRGIDSGRRLLLRTLLSSAYLPTHPNAIVIVSLILDEYKVLEDQMLQQETRTWQNSLVAEDLSTIFQQMANAENMIAVMRAIECVLLDQCGMRRETKHPNFVSLDSKATLSKRAYASEVYELLESCSTNGPGPKLTTMLSDLQKVALEQGTPLLEVLAFTFMEPLRRRQLDSRDSAVFFASKKSHKRKFLCISSMDNPADGGPAMGSGRKMNGLDVKALNIPDDELKVILGQTPTKDIMNILQQFKNDHRMWEMDPLILADVCALIPSLAESYLVFLMDKINQRIGEQISGMKIAKEVPSYHNCHEKTTGQFEIVEEEHFSLEVLAYRIHSLSTKSTKMKNLCRILLEKHSNAQENMKKVLIRVDGFKNYYC